MNDELTDAPKPRMPFAFTESSWAMLAGARFLLAAIVFLTHLPWFTKLPWVLASLQLLGGKAAVLGFLLISGVSIGHSYIERPNGYFHRRFLRIYPLYFFAVGFALLLTYSLGSPYELPGRTMAAAHWKTNLANFFFLQGFASITITYNEPLWTISMEVFYYLLVPLLSRMRLIILAGMVFASMLLFIFSHKDWIFGYQAARYAWPWLIGFMFATRGPSKSVALFALLGIFATAVNKKDTGDVLSWLTVASVVAIISLADRVKFSANIRAVLNFLGEQSYPLYLFHVPLCLALFRYAGIRSAWGFIAATLICVVILDYVLDHWLKKVFWKPAVQFISQLFVGKQVKQVS
jgi:peptidoglycan/LPS O-acetylase OafA/YrhL